MRKVGVISLNAGAVFLCLGFLSGCGGNKLTTPEQEAIQSYKTKVSKQNQDAPIDIAVVTKTQSSNSETVLIHALGKPGTVLNQSGGELYEFQVENANGKWSVVTGSDRGTWSDDASLMTSTFGQLTWKEVKTP